VVQLYYLGGTIYRKCTRWYSCAK